MFKTEELQIKIDLLDKLIDHYNNNKIDINNAYDLVCNLRAKYQEQLNELKRVHTSIENS